MYVLHVVFVQFSTESRKDEDRINFLEQSIKRKVLTVSRAFPDNS